MMTAARAGLVSLVGAGPGAADLITVRGLERLRHADVVLYDRLVNADLLEEAPARALRIAVGKAPGGPAVSQGTIDRLLVTHARAGLRVVHLKGGDPFVFGRGGEELLACAAAGIACEIVPGVSSAIAGPAAAGIPVTHRHLAGTIAIVTGHRAPGEADRSEREGASPSLARGEVDWSFAARADTLVVMMGVARLSEICAALIAHGRAAETPAAIIERATLPDQRVLYGTLADLPERAEAEDFATPAVTVVGAVVAIGTAVAAALGAAGAFENPVSTPRDQFALFSGDAAVPNGAEHPAREHPARFAFESAAEAQVSLPLGARR